MKTRIKKSQFKNSAESLKWVAEMNENNFCYEQAINIYREIGDAQSVERCEKMLLILKPKPKTKN